MDSNAVMINLRENLQCEVTPLELKNSHWKVKDRKALWLASSPRIFDAHLDKFSKLTLEVLTEIDPKFDLPPEERFAASVHGKILEHSKSLRYGMAETLAILGTNGGTLTNCSLHKAETVAIITVRKILEHADWRLWGSLRPLLPLLAEAAPKEFLCAIEEALKAMPCPFDELLNQDGDGFLDTDNIYGLLWALETLAWHEDYIAQVIVILAELSTHEKPRNGSAKSENSITKILLPWIPQTLAPIKKRIACINAVRVDFPDVAWNVLLALLPNQFQTSSGSYKPKWRNPLPAGWESKITTIAYWEQVDGYAKLATDMACDDLGKLTQLVDNLDNLPKSSFDRILGHLSSSAIVDLSEAKRLPIWTNLTAFAAKHRRYSEAEWALPAEIVDKIKSVADLLSPKSPEGKYKHLFSNKDFDLYEENGDWEKQRKQLDKRREDAVEGIITVNTIQGVLNFAKEVEAPYQLGWALGNLGSSECDAIILPEHLCSDSENIKQLVSGYVCRRHQNYGWAWVDEKNTDSWGTDKLCEFLTLLPFDVGTWKRANELLKDSVNQYWRSTPVHSYHIEGDIFIAIDKLLEVSRPNEAINCLYHLHHKGQPLDVKKTIKALLDAVNVEKPKKSMDFYHITDLITALQGEVDVSDEDLFRVEWAYLPLLVSHNGGKPKHLEARLATQPDFFCEVIRLMYRSTHVEKTDNEVDEQQKSIASNAWRLLHAWKTAPGMIEGDEFSAKHFKVWLKDVKRQCNESGHIDVAMLKVGEVLYYCPPDPSGLWIVKEVAQELNARDAHKMRDGFRLEVFNSRGAHLVDTTGKEELGLAEKWKNRASDLENAGFARFAATLRALAESYVRESERIIEQHSSSNDDG